MLLLLIIFSILGGYLIGSLNFAIIVCKITRKEDIRHFGSGNAGMTNMLRIYGKGAAIATLLGDVSKGIIAVLLTWLAFHLSSLICPIWLNYAVGFAAMLGHTFPVFYGFRGGKGVMIAIGLLFLLTPLPACATLGVFLIVVAFSRTVSLSSMIASISAPFWIWLFGSLSADPDMPLKAICTAVMALFIIVMHRSNILRLIHGEENSFRSKKEKK